MIDAGAHNGADSVEFARLFAGVTIHAFEPVPEVYTMLVANTRRWPQIHCYPLALSNRNELQMLHLSGGASDASSSLLEAKMHFDDHPDVTFDTQCLVHCQTLDTWVRSSAVGEVDFMWLDLQGFELEALRAGEAVLRGVRAIHTEVSVRETYTGAALYPDLKYWLESRGFVVDVEAIPRGSDMGNVLFVRRT
jgi:FkbM family methyltransferase